MSYLETYDPVLEHIAAEIAGEGLVEERDEAGFTIYKKHLYPASGLYLPGNDPANDTRVNSYKPSYSRTGLRELSSGMVIVGRVDPKLMQKGEQSITTIAIM
jgi:hypothetical protein